jgi:hypothetical protein
MPAEHTDPTPNKNRGHTGSPAGHHRNAVRAAVDAEPPTDRNAQPGCPGSGRLVMARSIPNTRWARSPDTIGSDASVLPRQSAALGHLRASAAAGPPRCWAAGARLAGPLGPRPSAPALPPCDRRILDRRGCGPRLRTRFRGLDVLFSNTGIRSAMAPITEYHREVPARARRPRGRRSPSAHAPFPRVLSSDLAGQSPRTCGRGTLLDLGCHTPSRTFRSPGLWIGSRGSHDKSDGARPGNHTRRHRR